jgi:hypothetical protein
LPTSGWRSPASSSLGIRRALWPQPTSPPLHPKPPLRRASAPLRCAPPLSRTAWRRALSRSPQALAFLPPPRLLVRGRGLLPLGESSPPVALLLLFLIQRRVLRGRRGREFLLLTQPKLLTPLFSALPPPDSPLLLARRPLLLLPQRRARVLRLESWAGQTARRPRSPAAGDERKVRPRRRVAGKREAGQKFHPPAGRGGA